MVTLPRVISRAPVTGGGAIVRDPGVGVAPAQALTRVAGQAQQLAFSFGEEQRKLNQFNETLERETRIRQKSSDLIEQSRNNPAPGHTQRVEEGLQNILNEELQDTEDAEVDFFIRRSTLPSIDREISNAKAFEIKQGVDRGKAAIFRSNQDAKFNARRATGPELDEQLAVLNRNYAGAVQRGILTREQAAKGLARDKDDILQAKANDLVRTNPEEYLRMSGEFKFLNPKTASMFDERARTELEAIAREEDRRQSRIDAEAEKEVKRQQKLEVFRTEQEYRNGTLTVQGLTDKVQKMEIDPMQARPYLQALEIDSLSGGRSDPGRVAELKLQIRERNFPSNESILTDRSMNFADKNDVLDFREKIMNGDLRSENPTVNRSRQDLKRDITGSANPLFAQFQKPRVREALSLALRQYDDRVGEGEDPVQVQRELSDKFRSIAASNEISSGDSGSLARALVPVFGTPQAVEQAIRTQALPKQLGDLVIMEMKNPGSSKPEQDSKPIKRDEVRFK